MLPIASSMPFPMYMVLVLLLVGHAVLSLLATRARANDDRARADRFAGIAFALVLASAVYLVVLLVATAISYSNRISDMLIIIVMIVVFFAILLFVFFLLAEVLPRAVGRGRHD
jgi:cytochrome bd-type quinol oxidase subunit 2